jgi:hypothetical protein
MKCRNCRVRPAEDGHDLCHECLDDLVKFIKGKMMEDIENATKRKQ